VIWPELTRIEPVFSPRIWGVHSLAPYFPEKVNAAEPLGEAWLTGVDCKIATGPFTGRSLGEAWREMKTQWRGTSLKSVPDFPLLVKFIFPNDKLSIQVHPDDAYASVHEKEAGGRGKTEMWHVVSAEQGAQLLLGMKPGTTKEKFQRALRENTLEDLFEPRSVHTGDTFFVPPGTPHTIGPKMVICEVQEYSDLTYRVYDYGRVDSQGRPRQLHVEKALEVMNFGRFEGKTSPLQLPAEGIKRYLLAACRYFAAERWECTRPVDVHTNGEWFQLIVILSGSGEFRGLSGTTKYRRGETWFLPAALDSPMLTPYESTTLLLAYVRDLTDLKSDLLDSGINEKALSGVLFE
jgi:mannose-6-phosphate isomerase